MVQRQASCPQMHCNRNVQLLIGLFEGMCKPKVNKCRVQPKGSRESLTGRVAATRAIFEHKNSQSQLPQSCGDSSTGRLLSGMEQIGQAVVQRKKKVKLLKTVLFAVESELETSTEIKSTNPSTDTLTPNQDIQARVSFNGWRLRNGERDIMRKTHSSIW